MFILLLDRLLEETGRLFSGHMTDHRTQAQVVIEIQPIRLTSKETRHDSANPDLR